MKDVEKMTLKEAIGEFSEMLLKYLPDNDDNDRFEELYNRIQEDADIDVYVNDFTATICVIPANGEECEVITNVMSGDFFDAWMAYDNYYPDEVKQPIYCANKYAIQAKCATCSSPELQKELTDEVLQKVFKGHQVVSFDYLLANPRKEVIEWALKHKDELGLNKVEHSFVEKYQAIPELRELILRTLKT